MNEADRQLTKMSNMLAEHMGTVDALRRELRETRDQHSATVEKQDVALETLNAIHELTAEMLATLQQEQAIHELEPEPQTTPEPSNVAHIDNWKPGQPEHQGDLALPDQDAETSYWDAYRDMHQQGRTA